MNFLLSILSLFDPLSPTAESAIDFSTPLDQKEAAEAYLLDQLCTQLGSMRVHDVTTDLAIKKTKDAAEVAIQDNKKTAAQGGNRGNHGLRGIANLAPSVCEATVKTKKTRKPNFPLKASTVANIADAITTKEIPAGKVRIEVVQGPTEDRLHTGMVYTVEPLFGDDAKTRWCMIGRSKCRQVKDFGVSLHLDKGVSTNHATLTRIGMDYHYKDIGSSNGTFNPSGDPYEELEPYNLKNGYKLENGTRLLMGRSILQFNFLA